jgi:hypothetical protein
MALSPRHGFAGGNRPRARGGLRAGLGVRRPERGASMHHVEQGSTEREGRIVDEARQVQYRGLDVRAGTERPRAIEARGAAVPEEDRALPQAPGHAAVPRFPDGMADGCPTYINAARSQRLVQLRFFSREPLECGLQLAGARDTLN